MMSRLATELELLGQHIIVLAPAGPNSDAFDRMQRYRVSRYSGGGRVGRFVGMLRNIFRATSNSRKATVLADSWFPSGLAVCLVPRFFRGRFALLAHGTEIANSRRGIRLRAMRFVFGQADRIIANSNYTRHLLMRAGVTGKIHVISPGVDPELVTPARSNFPTVVSVGRLVARKGFDTMIRAMPAVLELYPAARYEIVGVGPQREILETLASDLNVSDHVTFLGSISDDEMQQAYARAWLFSLPVRAVDYDVEGFGMVYLEAALAELAVIGGSNSGAEDAIVHDETGLLVDGTSTQEVAAAVLALLSDRKRAQQMGMRGKARAITRFTWERSAAEFAGILEEA